MCVQIAAKKDRPRTSSLVTGRSQVPNCAGVLESDHSGVTPVEIHWSDSRTPAQVGTCDLPVTMELVARLSFLAAI